MVCLKPWKIIRITILQSKQVPVPRRNICPIWNPLLDFMNYSALIWKIKIPAVSTINVSRETFLQKLPINFT